MDLWVRVSSDYDVVAFCPAVSLFCLSGLCHIEAYRIVSLAGCSVFMLNYAALFITLLAVILGNGFTRLRMTVPLENPEWRASDEKNEMIELPLVIELVRLRSMNILLS